MKAIAIALKDVRRTLRSPVALAMMLGAPLLLTFLLGSAFGGAGGFTVPVTDVAVVNLDTLSAGSGGRHDRHHRGRRRDAVGSH